MEDTVLIEAENVGISFRSYAERIDSLKELFIGMFKGKLKRKTFRCLDGVNFCIRRGESVAILGRNGAGKSTLLKILSGILPPDTGSVRINGRLTPMLQLGAGFDHNASGYENVFLNGAILGYTKREIEAKIDEILEFAELGDFIHEPVKNYSAGMLARLGFAIAVCMEPDTLLIDEILAVGDGAFRTKCNKKFEELRAKGATFVIVTHVTSIYNTCERAIWIDKGKVIEDGPSKEVCAHYSDYLKQLTAEKEKAEQEKIAKERAVQAENEKVGSEQGGQVKSESEKE